ncbi:hypothetical protein [Caviibacterium pharyngocola]|uniref:AsmA-like C-terminal domain-containing protein n=1 Tax=Caviibacterium pharyngocola TaxID=28159 RepID=A0A2M8RZ51_9PAST|nr:hypothetical protein [Caviibacterium pharyngocola]PJG84167.1 hypothetical protein CVP04_00185 [Caviibacterium pharyngocola]
MWRRIALPCVLFIIAIFSVIYIQETRLERQFVQALQKQNVQFEDVDFQLFPIPKITLQNASAQFDKERSFFFEKINVELSPLAAFIGKVRLEQIELQRGKLTKPNFSEVNLTIKPTALYLKDLPDVVKYFQTGCTGEVEMSDKWRYFVDFEGKDKYRNHLKSSGEIAFNGPDTEFKNFSLNLDLYQPLYADDKQFYFKLDQGILSTHKDGHKVLLSYNLHINDELFTYINASFIREEKDLLLYLLNNNKAFIKINLLSFYADRSGLVLVSGKDLDVNKWLNALKLPQILSGKVDFDAELAFFEQRINQGKAHFTIQNGEFSGLNILSIVSNHLPINYDPAQLQNANSAFERLEGKLRWEPTRLWIDELFGEDKRIRLSGRGIVELPDVTCDITLELKAQEEKYRKFGLPIRFFDQCAAPQYEILLNGNLREQIRDFLKEKFRR